MTLFGFTEAEIRLIIILWVASNLVSTMPTPNGNGMLASPLYKWMFNFLHGVFGMVGRIMRKKLGDE